MDTIRYSKMDKEKIIKRLMAGGIIAFPTDTVFGLGCIVDEEAMKKIYAAKGRDFNKPLPMMCDGLEMIGRYAYVSDEAARIAGSFMPGAITLIFSRHEDLPDYVTMGQSSIAIRVPDDEWILSLISGMGQPLLVTSANVSGEGSLLRYEDVYECLKGKIDGIVCEDARGELASTIVDVRDEIKIVREGPIGLEEIMEVIR